MYSCKWCWKSSFADYCLPRSHPEFCFSVNHTGVKFFDAVSACQAIGKHVATILDDSQQDFVLRALRQVGSPIWQMAKLPCG